MAFDWIAAASGPQIKFNIALASVVDCFSNALAPLHHIVSAFLDVIGSGGPLPPLCTWPYTCGARSLGQNRDLEGILSWCKRMHVSRNFECRSFFLGVPSYRWPM